MSTETSHRSITPASSLLIVATTLLASCAMPDGPVDDPPPMESIVALAEHSEQLQTLVKRVPREWPGLSLNMNSSHAVEDDAFGEGELVGVHFAIRGGEQGSFVSLWYSPDTQALRHTVLAVVTRDEDVVYSLVEVDGAIEHAQSTSAGPTTTLRGPMLTMCIRSCAGPIAGREALCRALPPHPVLRVACWGAIYLGYAACTGFCFRYL